MNDTFGQAFKEEALEYLEDLESSLLQMEDNPHDLELVGRVFRVMHTIKGSGAMFGYDDIASFTHNVESVYDLVRSGNLPVTKDLINLSLAARDRILAMLKAADNDTAVDRAQNEQVIEGFRRLLPTPRRVDNPVSETDSSIDDVVAPSIEASTITYRIRFCPIPEIFRRGTNPLILLNELREMGTCTVVAQMTNLPDLTELDEESCYLFWDVILTTSRGVDAIRDTFIFVEGDCELKIEAIDDGGVPDNGEGYKKLGEILVERGDLTREEMEMVLGRHKRFGELAVEAGLVDGNMVASALAEQEHIKALRQEIQTHDAVSSVRVPADKLDVLVNLMGELVTAQARLSQVALTRKDPVLGSVAEVIERLTADLRDNALSIRMLPIGSTFNKFKRLVRDLANELGKTIELTIEGAETELDKTVIERLNDPLVHIIRNSIDHGIEPPDEREAKGKPRQGTLHLGAVHSGDSVLITIRDDGAGLDREAIRAKAVEQNLITPAAELSDKEIWSLIFAPGFSTAQKVTSVSGRGVGMDVVKQAIDALRGTIQLTSERGAGTTISIRIPLTLAIIESLLAQIGNERFVFPLSLVDECILLASEDVAKSHGRNIMQVRGHAVPYVSLRQRFDIAGTVPSTQQVVICQVGGRRIGFVVDWVIGEHQTVIKSLGRMYRQAAGVAGATVLGDGSVALILDIPMIVQHLEETLGGELH